MKSAFLFSLMTLSFGVWANLNSFLPTSVKCQDVDENGVVIDDGMWVSGDLEKSFGSPIVGPMKMMDPGHADLELRALQYKYDPSEVYILAMRELTSKKWHEVIEVSADAVNVGENQYKGKMRQYILEDDSDHDDRDVLCTFK